MNQEGLTRLAIAIIGAMLAFLKLLGYVVAIRPAIERLYGLYFLGLCDGVVLLVTGILFTIAIAVALVSIVRMAQD